MTILRSDWGSECISFYTSSDRWSEGINSYTLFTSPIWMYHHA